MKSATAHVNSKRRIIAVKLRPLTGTKRCPARAIQQAVIQQATAAPTAKREIPWGKIKAFFTRTVTHTVKLLIGSKDTASLTSHPDMKEKVIIEVSKWGSVL